MPKRYSEKAKVWALLIKTHGGSISLIQGMDSPTARAGYRSLLPQSRPWLTATSEHVGASTPDITHLLPMHMSDSDVTDITIIGPADCELDPWRDLKA